MLEIIKFCIFLQLIVPSIAWGYGCHPLNSGINHIAVCYKVKDRHVTLKINSKIWTFPLSGYTATDFHISPLQNDPKYRVISYVDLAGVSAGGSANILLWRNGTLASTCHLDLYANLLQQFTTGGKTYIALIQHYTQNYYYVSAIFEINRSGITETNDLLPWHVIINNYIDELNNSRSRYAKSIYSAFTAGAYIHLGDLNMADMYTKGAESMSKEASSFISALPTLSNNSRKHLRTGKWCLIRVLPNANKSQEYMDIHESR